MPGATRPQAATFPGAGAPLAELGFDLVEVRSSGEQRSLSQEVDLVLTSPDNLYAWAAAGDPPLSLVAGGDVPGLGLYEGSDGPLAVDAPDSGFAFLARALDGDRRELLAVGATPARAEAIRSGRAGAALLHPPFTEGLQLAAAVHDHFPDYQAMVLATRLPQLDQADEVRKAFGVPSDEGLRTVWKLRRRYAPAACPDTWRLPAVTG